MKNLFPSNFERMIKDRIFMYHFYKKRGYGYLALDALKQALFLKRLIKKESERRVMQK